MKILIFSDTHCDTAKMADIIGRHRLTTDLVIHLGDCCTDLVDIRSDFPQIAMLYVRGNCDFGFDAADAPMSADIALEGHRIFYTHGTRYRVGTTLDDLAYAAESKGCDIALFGHTHVGLTEKVGGVTVFNPGSLRLPRDGTKGTYGILTLNGEKTLFERKEYGT